MRGFIVFCLIAVACAQESGYNYHQGSHADGSGISGGSGGLVGGMDALSGGNGGLGGGMGGLSGGNGGFSGGSGDLSAGNDGVSAGNNFDAASAPAEFEKEFITFSADESEFADPNAAEKAASSVKQGLRVVFIKGPENKGLEDAALALAKQAANQETAIYVLNKQTDIGDLANKLNAINSASSNKPEVHFVKYRTPEDAVNAQRTIQGQYESLGGASQSVNGGVAPVLNFASQAAAREATPQTPQSSYLPSSLFRKRL
ncbi:transcription factor Maf-like [Stomoxys calcitrans]|uniref:transcription factor Maf-like n=1 Tax=Stomoxys calcitrans TaxID=35570 RepID=UPI0027E2B6A6|nr:transcription factor Maf-like [Stomoxys calcitrans]